MGERGWAAGSQYNRRQPDAGIGGDDLAPGTLDGILEEAGSGPEAPWDPEPSIAAAYVDVAA